MFQIITDFIDGISSFSFTIPLWLQITIIIIVIIVISIGAYFSRDYFDTTYMRSGIIWFVFIAILNLSTILAIFIYYNIKTNAINAKISDGKPGIPGERGKMGKRGKYINCNYCTNNIYIQTVRRTDVICTLNTYTDEFKIIKANVKFFEDILTSGNSIAYDSFVNGIILGKKVLAENTNSVNKFRTLMSPTAIAIQLIKVLNESITKASDDSYGTFRNPTGKIGYLPIGDCVYGGLENFELNSFMLKGDTQYPPSYTKLVTFTSYNQNTSDIDTYTLWRPDIKTIGSNTYQNLGDLCRYGTTPPKLNEVVTIKDSCITPVSSSDLTLVYIYVGPLDFNDDKTKLDYTKTNSYLIQDKMANNIEIFSVWRTPMNTFITNCKSNNAIVNNTFMYNMYNNSHDAVTDYNTISNDYKTKASNLLQSINIPKILIATILCKHFEIELYKEIVYYFHYYQSKVPEFKNVDPIALSFGDVMKKIQDTIDAYDKFNENLVKTASLNLKDPKYIKYDSKNEKTLPQKLLAIYNNVNNTLLTISYYIENANSLLDIVNIMFDTGIEARIAKNANGIAEGGIFLNEIQETILMLCKIIMPPTQAAYTIKDECLGTFAIDRNREQIIKNLTEIKDQYYKLNDEILLDTEKYRSIAISIKQYNDLLTAQIGQLCGHIDNYLLKLDKMNLEEFTTSRIKSLVQYYENIVQSITNAMDAA